MPADPHRAVLLRRIEAVDGPAEVTVVLDVRGGYGAPPDADLPARGLLDRAQRAGAVPLVGRRARRGTPGGALRMTVRLGAGEHHDLVLEMSDREFTDEPPDAGRLWAATEEAWSQVVPDCDDLIAVADARHAYAVLRGLTSASGAMVAAATTSLPERLEGGRNYDYRYAWIRDQCYAGLAVAAHGPHPLLAGAVRFVTERVLADGPELMPGYTVSGRADPAGAAAAAARLPRRVARGPGTGCAASSSSTRSARRCRCSPPPARHDMLGEDDWRAAAVAADAIEKRWREPDAGIWELDNKRWTHSRLACVSGPARDRRRGGRGAARQPRAPRGGPVERAGRRASRPAWATACTRPAGGSGHRTTSGWTRRCCCR